MLHVLNATSSGLLRLLVIAAVVAIPVLLITAWRTARRWRLVVAELVNGTSEDSLNGSTPGLTQLARQRIDTEIRLVSQRRDMLYAALSGAAGTTQKATAPTRIERRLDDSLAQLLSAARDVAPKQAQPAVQLLTMLVSRPRGLLVSSIVQRRGSVATPRLGITFDVLHLNGNQSVASQTFWEPATPARTIAKPADQTADEASWQERFLRLLGPAARWVAIQLVVHSVFPRPAKGSEKGIDRLLSGILLLQSSGAYPDAASTFRRRAAEDLIDAAEVLEPSALPLAALADNLDRLAAQSDSGKEGLYARAHAAYAAALGAISAVSPPDTSLLRHYQVRQTVSWFASGLPEPREMGMHRLADAGFGAPLPESASHRYDLACLYALAGEASDRTDLCAQAARFLVAALAADLPERTLWTTAEQDPQLRPLHGLLDAFKAAINERADAERHAVPCGPDIESIIEKAFHAASKTAPQRIAVVGDQ